MNKLSKLFIFSATGILISCGNGNLATKTSEEAIAIAKNILEKQSDETIFKIPNNYSINTSKNINSETFLPISGKAKLETSTTSKTICDFENLKYYFYEKFTTTSLTYEEEAYHFFDNKTGKFYSLFNNNTYKTRTEYDSSVTDAQKRLEEIRENDKILIKYNSYLTNFEQRDKEYSTLHETYKDEKDQYFNYSYGSNDSKSIQTITKSKFNQSEKEEEFELTGYVESENNAIMKNYMFSSYTNSEKYELKDSTGTFYYNYSYSSSTNIDYSGSINVPNIEDYKKV